jgi:acyl-CoA thioesterase-2
VSVSNDGDVGDIPSIPDLLAIEPIGAERFRGVSPLDWPGGRVFGGLVAAQALRAAGATVRDARPHSLHAYFLRLGRPDLPLDYTVNRIRDGRSFATRSVDVTQGGEVIFTMTASFHRPEDGEDYQVAVAADAPRPDDALVGDVLPHLQALSDLEVRDLGPTAPAPDGTFRSTRRMWLRVRGPVADDPMLHACILTFMSDMGIVVAVRPPRTPLAWDTVMAASLDHAVWFHRPAKVDGWLLYDLHSLSLSGSRGVTRGVMHDSTGRLCCSVTQEALVRTTDGRPGRSWGQRPEV